MRKQPAGSNRWFEIIQTGPDIFLLPVPAIELPAALARAPEVKPQGGKTGSPKGRLYCPDNRIIHIPSELRVGMGNGSSPPGGIMDRQGPLPGGISWQGTNRSSPGSTTMTSGGKRLFFSVRACLFQPLFFPVLQRRP